MQSGRGHGGQVAISGPSSSEAHTPICLEVVEEINKKISDLSNIVQEEMRTMKKGFEKSLILTNATSLSPVLSAQLLAGLLAQGLLPKVQPNLKIPGVTIPAAQVQPTPAKASIDAAKKDGRVWDVKCPGKSGKAGCP